MTDTDREMSISETNEFEMLVDEIRERIQGIGTRLLKIRDGKLYRESYESFEEFVKAEFSFSVRRAQQLMHTARVIGNIEMRTNGSPAELSVLPNERQSRELLNLAPDEQAAAWEEVVKTAASQQKKPTAKLVKAVVEKKRGQALPPPSKIRIPSTNGHLADSAGVCPTCQGAGYVKMS